MGEGPSAQRTLVQSVELKRAREPTKRSKDRQVPNPNSQISSSFLELGFLGVPSWKLGVLLGIWDLGFGILALGVGRWAWALGVGSTIPMTPVEQEGVRAFRRQAQDIRRALAALGGEQTSSRRMVDGYIEVDRWLERYRRLCVPVRRTFLTHDKASFRQSSAVLRALPDEELRQAAETATDAYQTVMEQLAQETVLGGRRVKGTDMVKAWLDAAVFYDSTGWKKAVRRDARVSREGRRGTRGRVHRRSRACGADARRSSRASPGRTSGSAGSRTRQASASRARTAEPMVAAFEETVTASVL